MHPRPNPTRRLQVKRKPLHLAALSGDSKMLTLLLQRNADVNTFDKVKRLYPCAFLAPDSSPIDLVFTNGFPQHTVLTTSNATQERDSPLHLAAAKGNVNAAKLLVQHGADVKATNAVRRSISDRCAHTVLLLLPLCCLPYVSETPPPCNRLLTLRSRHQANKTPGDLARANGHMELADVVVKV